MSTRGAIRRVKALHCVLGLSLLAALTFSGPALAGKPRAGPDAYSELVPTSSGDKAVGSGNRAGAALPLTATAVHALRNARSSSGGLRAVATSPRLGAPTKQLPKPAQSSVPRNASLGAGIGSATSAVGGGSDHLLALVAALGATTAVVLAAAIVRARARRR
jgi:hypothetical protein